MKRKSLEHKIKELAERGVLYTVGYLKPELNDGFLSGKYCIIVKSGPKDGAMYASKSIHRCFTQLYNSMSNPGTPMITKFPAFESKEEQN